MSRVYYNENDPYAAQFLRNLIADGLLPGGDVDDRDLREVKASDVKGYAHAHFFAGIGGWPLALEIAGWPLERKIWTGSCPCQPFSLAGRRKGTADDRDLWPVWFDLIRQSDVPILAGEQVASEEFWLDRVRIDLEKRDFALGAAILPACSVDAPHKRDRFWFLAVAMAQPECAGSGGGRHYRPGQHPSPDRKRSSSQSERSGAFDGRAMVDAAGERRGEGISEPKLRRGRRAAGGASGGDDVDDTERAGRQGYAGDGASGRGRPQAGRSASETGGALSDAHRAGLRRQSSAGRQSQSGQHPGARDGSDVSDASGGFLSLKKRQAQGRNGAGSNSARSFWSDSEWAVGADGKARRVKPGIRLLADGIQARLAKLSTAGNAIVPQVAAEFLGAGWEAIKECAGAFESYRRGA